MRSTFRRFLLSRFALSLCLLTLVVVIGTFQAAKPAQAATGFHISGRNLVDANGNNFIMRGINHAYAWFHQQNSAFANIKATGANTVRVVIEGGARWTLTSASEVSTIISLCKTNKLICILEDHDTTGYGEDSTATSLANAVNYWKSIQSALTGQESYVIINIGNEPYGNTNYGNWVNDTKNAIIAMRAAGFQHTLMVDGPNWGQDWSNTMRDNAASVFNSDSQHNLIFSVHMYGVYKNASIIQSYVSSYVNAGLPLVIGEFGNMHTDGDPDEDSIMATAQSNQLGYVGWSWSGNGSTVAYLDMVTNFDPNQRTAWGNRIISGANGISSTAVECSIYGNRPTATFSGPTNTPGATTTVTDDLNDWSKSFSHTANLGFDTTNTALMGNDGSRADRSTSTNENIVWKLSNLTSAKFTTYFWPNETVSHFSFATSSDGSNWTTVTPSISGGTGNWIQYVYTFNGLSNANYIKVIWNNTSGNAWSPQIGQVILTGSNAATETTVPPTNTSVPATATFAPPTNTSVPPTATTIAPTATSIILTNTSVPPTNTSIPPTVTTGNVKVQIQSTNTDSNQQSQFNFKLLNTGSTAQSNLSVRVYFTTENGNAASSYVLEKYWDQSGVATVSGPTAYSGSTYYFTVSWGANALSAGSSWEFHTALHLSSWATTFDSTNDWWRSGTYTTSFADTTHLPAYTGSTLTWGVQP